MIIFVLLLFKLRRIEKLRHDILNLDSKTIAEIKSYSKPPDAVHFVMCATFLLLGESDKNLRVSTDQYSFAQHYITERNSCVVNFSSD